MSSPPADPALAIEDLHPQRSNSDAATAFLVARLCPSDDGESRSGAAGRAGVDVRGKARWISRLAAQARRARADSLAQRKAAVLSGGGSRRASLKGEKRRT